MSNMVGRLQFRHDPTVYDDFSFIKERLDFLARNEELTENKVLAGEPYIFHYLDENGDGVKTVLAIADVWGIESNRHTKYAVIDMDELTNFLLKERGEIHSAITKNAENITALGIETATTAETDGRTIIYLERPSDPEIYPFPPDPIEIDITDFLQNTLNEANAYTDSEISALTVSVDEKLAALESADDALTDIIEAEASARTAADSALTEALSAETAAREAAESEIYDAISAETAARESAIADEESARKEADNALLEAISALTAEMGASDADQAEKIENLETRMSVAESGITVLGDTKVDKEAGKGLSTNDYTNEEKAKLAEIEEGAQANIIETVKVNGVELEPDVRKAVNVSVPFQRISDEERMLTLTSAGTLYSDFNVEYDSDAKKIYFYGKNESKLGEINAADFLVDGMLNEVEVITSAGTQYLKFTFNTAAGEKILSVPLTDLVTIYSVSGGSENYLLIDEFKIGIKTGENGLATERSVSEAASALTYQIHELDDKYSAVTHNIEDIVGDGFTGTTLTYKIVELREYVEQAIEAMDENSGKINVPVGGFPVGTPVTTVLLDIYSKLNSATIDSDIYSGSTVFIPNGTSVTEAVRRIVNAMAAGGSGYISNDIRDKDGNVIVRSGATTTDAVEALLDYVEEANSALTETINDLDERLREIEEEGSLVRNLVGDEDIEVTGPDESGITHVSLLGISNPEVTELDMERTVIIRFQGVSRPDITESSYWGTGYTFTTPETENPTDRWKIDMNLDGDTEDPVDIIVNGGEKVTVDLTNQGENAIITAKLYQQA